MNNSACLFCSFDYNRANWWASNSISFVAIYITTLSFRISHPNARILFIYFICLDVSNWTQSGRHTRISAWCVLSLSSFEYQFHSALDHISRLHMRNNSRFLFINKTKRTRFFFFILSCQIFQLVMFLFMFSWVSVSFLLVSIMYAMRSRIYVYMFYLNLTRAHEFMIRYDPMLHNKSIPNEF